MTREEAMRIAQGLITDFKCESETMVEFCNVVIKALEQEPILDKIRAEIMQLDYDTESVDYDYDDIPQTEIVHTICREEVLNIITKYKSESEG